MPSLRLIKGYAADWPLQTYLLAGGGEAAYAAADTLAASVLLHHAGATVFVPGVAWYTAAGTQTGYQDGQVIVSISAAQAALLEVSGRYTLAVLVTPASDPSKTYPIARLPIAVEPIAFPC